MSVTTSLPFQLEALGPLPAVLLALVAAGVVILVARVALSVAWKVVIVLTVVAVLLWVFGLLGPVSSFLPV